MSSPWVLALDPPSPGGDPARKLGGLPLALRLALDAQVGGAAGVVCSAELAPLLADARRRVPLLDTVPAQHRAIRVPSSLLLHRSTLKALGAGDESSPASFSPAVAYGFAGVDVTNEGQARRAERLLFRSLRKQEDGWTARWLNRYLSLALSRWLVKTPLRPNQVSVGILAVGLCGAWLAARGSYSSIVWGALLFQAQSVLDGCDGEMSRVTHRGSHRGEWLDTIGDDLTNYGFFGGLALGLYHATTLWLYLAAGLIAVGCGSVASAIEYRYLIGIGSGDLLKYPLSQGQGTGRFRIIQPLFKRDTFVLLTLVACALGYGGPMLCVFALGAIGVLVGVLRTELRLARERRRERSATREVAS